MVKNDTVRIPLELKDMKFDKPSGKAGYYDANETKDMSFRISIIYSVVGALWILLSDKVLEVLISEKKTIAFLSMIKGWIYVLITGAIIYQLVSYYIKKIRSLEKDLICSDLKLSLADKELELLRKYYRSLQKDKIILNQKYQRNQKQLNQLEDRYNIIMEATNDVIWEESDGLMCFSDRWYEITGYSRNELETKEHWENLLHPTDKMNVLSFMKAQGKDKSPYFQFEYRIKAKSNQYKWLRARGKLLINAQGQIYRKIGIYTDISELKEYELKLNNIACYDQLTGLQNRVALNGTLHSLIHEKFMNNFALLFIDIDNFKYVNDTMGHTFGDNLLLEISERLSSLCTSEATLFRIGGDEFVIITQQFNRKEEIERRAIEIIRDFKTRFEVAGNTMFLTVSIGVSLYPEHGTDADTLLKNADIAVHKAKETGKNRIVFYNEPMNEIIAERMYIEKYLWTALLNNEFELHYQPQLDLKTNNITGFEALIRWKNAELGMVSPTKFIGIAEETRQIIPIGAWVFKSACEFLRRLHHLGHEELNISVNISMLQLLQDDFVEMVIDTIESVGVNARHVELEITESILMEAYETIAGKLKLLRSKGIKMALDDFGKGYSSLNYLKQLPITTLKIDKTFIDTISGNEKNKSLTDLIVNLGRSMNLNVVAEGVETKEQMDYLTRHKCNKIQGYYFSKPLPENEILKMISEQWCIQKQIKSIREENA